MVYHNRGMLVIHMLSADINFNSELINGLLRERETVDINIHFVMTFHVKLINPPKILVQAYILLYCGEKV